MKHYKLLYVLMLVLLVSSAYADFNTSLLSYWSFDDAKTNSTNATSSGVSASGFWKGTVPTSAPCKVNECRFFNATTSYLNITRGLMQDAADASYSMSAWIYPTVSGSAVFAGTQSGGSNGVNAFTDGTPKIFLNKAGVLNLDYSYTYINKWTHVVFIQNATGMYWFANGTQVASNTNTASFALSGSATAAIGRRAVDLSSDQQYYGYVDEIAFWGRALNTSEVTQLYNSGSGYNPFDGPGISYFQITGFNDYDSQALTTFNVSLQSGDVVYNFSTTNGTIITNITTTNASLWNMTLKAANYFDAPIVQSYNVTSSGNYQARFAQSFVTFNVTRIHTNISLPLGNVTLNGTLQDVSFIWNLTAVNYTGLFQNTGYSNLSRLFNVSALFNGTIDIPNVSNNLNLKLQDQITGVNLTSFNATIHNVSYGLDVFLETTNGTIVFPTDYIGLNVTLRAANYPEESNVVQVESYNQTETFQVFASNSLLIYLRNEVTGDFIFEPITVTVTGTNTSFQQTNITSTAQLYLTNMSADQYSVEASGDNYTRRIYQATLTSGSNQVVNVYLANSSNQVLFTVSDYNSGSTVEAVTISMARIINNTWTTISVAESDITGRTQFNYAPNIKYRFIATKTGYLDTIFYLDPILFASYSISLTPSNSLEDNSQYAGIYTTHNGHTYANNVSTNFTLVFSSYDGALVDYGFIVSYPGGTGTMTSQNAYGASLTYNFTPLGTQVTDRVNITYWYSTVLSSNFTFAMSYGISNISQNGSRFADNQYSTYGLTVWERVFMAMILLIAVVGAATLAGGSVLGMSAGLLMMSYMAYISFVPAWSIVIAVIAGFIYLGGQR